MASHAVNLQDSSWVPPSDDIPRREFFIEFMLIVVFPLAVGLILFIVLSVLMFGRRQGLEKRNQTTPEPQMVQFDTIRRATTNLRYMSSRREGPPPLSPRLTVSTPNFPQPGCSNEEESRHSLPPPPYRLPPQYDPDDEGLQVPDPPRQSSSRTGSVHDTATLPMRSA